MELKMIKLKEIHANPLQPRQDFDREKLQELANSIKEGELLQPIVVRKQKDKFEIVAGERRFKAFQILKEPKIPSIILNIKNDMEALEKSTIENWHRADLKDNEKRKAINDLWKSKRYNSKAELSRKTGISLRSIMEYVDEEEFRARVHDLPEEVSHTRVRATEGLNDMVRKKAIQMSQEKQIPARKLEEEIVPKIKEFPEPEQQLEILEEFEEQEDFSRNAFDTIIEKKKEIAEGKRQPEVYIKEDKHERFVDELQNAFQNAECYGIANIETLPKVHYDRAIKLCLSHVAYWMNQLKQIGGNELIDELNKRLKE